MSADQPPPAPPRHIAIAVEHPAWTAALPDAAAVCRTAATAALADRAALGEISILLADDARLRDLNRTYRGIDRPTNVLSFPYADDGPLLGDIAVAYETTCAEAAARALPLDHHLCHLVVHGTLHVLGYDHETDAEAALMEDRERSLLAALGIADPYAAAAGMDGAS